MSTATSIAEAMSLVKPEHFDLFILCSRYSDGNGLDLCRQIRAVEPLTPIIFFSAEAYLSDIAAGLAAGAQEYLTQPLGIYTITQTIAKLFVETKNAPVNVHREPFRQPENQAHNLSAV